MEDAGREVISNFLPSVSDYNIIYKSNDWNERKQSTDEGASCALQNATICIEYVQGAVEPEQIYINGSSLTRDIEKFQKFLLECFELHCKKALYVLTFYLLDNLEEKLARFGWLKFPNISFLNISTFG